MFDDIPPWEPPAPPVSVPKAKPEPKPVSDERSPVGAAPDQWLHRRTAALGNAAGTETGTAPDAQSAPAPEPDRAPHPGTGTGANPRAGSAAGADPAPTGAFDWQALCAYMEHELPIGLYNLLLDPLQAAGELADGTLTLHLNKAPAYPLFNKPDIAEKFRLAVQKLTGQNVRVVMQPMDTASQINQRKIEELAHFPNVTIR